MEQSLPYQVQERMAIVVDSKDVDKMLAYAEEENLEAVVVQRLQKKKIGDEMEVRR